MDNASSFSWDSRVRFVVYGAFLLFALAVAFQINGSSIGVWKDVLRDEVAPAGVIFSTPKAVRSDEWMSWTPSILSQAFHRPPFPVENANLGAAKSPLLMSVPARHYAMFFRPQLWGFFAFDIETAFAFYWNAKFFALFVSFFLLLRVLTRNNFWISLFGAGWVCFSAYVQWWFSCPPMMPEMLASWATAILCVLYLFRAENRATVIVATLVLIIVGVNFTLCFYPAFQVPLVYLALAVIAGWLWQNRDGGLRWRAGLICLAAAGMGLAAVLIPYILECKPTLELLAQTKYPGSRRSHGGDLTITDAFNGVLGFFNGSERDYLATRDNPCEGSNFYPLWIFALVASGSGVWRERRQRRLELLLVACLALFTLYIFCPFPAWVCRVTLMSYVTGTRMLLSAGVAGILLTCLLLVQPTKRLGFSGRLVSAAAIIFGMIALAIASYPGNEKFLTPSRCAMLLAINLAFIGLYFFASPRIFCSAFLLSLILNNGAVNPIATGLGPLLDATPASTIRQIRERDPVGKWIVYSSAWLPQFFKTTGVDVINGLQIVPNSAFCRQLDAAGQYESVWNRYAFAVFQEIGPEEKREFRPFGPSAYILKVSPLDPVLRTWGARYAVFAERGDPEERGGMRLLASFPANKLWIYELPAAAP